MKLGTLFATAATVTAAALPRSIADPEQAGALASNSTVNSTSFTATKDPIIEPVEPPSFLDARLAPLPPGNVTRWPDPTSPGGDDVICDYHYHGFNDEYTVRGRFFDDFKLGEHGDGLYDNLRGCGGVAHWHFEWTPEDPNMEWFASFRMPVGTRRCVGNAVLTVGGNSKSGCDGAG